MDGIVRSVEDLLKTDISLAASADRLLSALRRVRPAATPSREHLIRELARHPESFRVLMPRRGPWHTADRGSNSGPFGAGASVATPVFVPLWEAPGSGEPRPGVRELMLNSLCRLGALLDEESSLAIARWVRLVHSASRTQSRLGRRTGNSSRGAPP